MLSSHDSWFPAAQANPGFAASHVPARLSRFQASVYQCSSKHDHFVYHCGSFRMEQLVLDLTNPVTRENALLELSKKRESFPELAPFLWHSFGTISALLQEIVSIYPLLSPPSLTAHASNRVCNALALLQCVASHLETRSLFLQGGHACCIIVACRYIVHMM